jgi:hypothetical protein
MTDRVGRSVFGLIDGKPCRVCGGDGWVCENHPDEPAFGPCCGGAGMPCGACALPMAADGFVQQERDAVVAFLRAEADMARHGQAKAEVGHPDKLYRMGQKDGLLLAALGVENRHHRIASADRSPKGGNHEDGCHAQHESAVPDRADAQKP